MHIPDGFVSGEINTAGYVISAAVGALALARARNDLGDRQIPLLGITAAFVFAAQMLNFPVAGGTSGHFLGSLLTAVMLGPLNAFLVNTVVLTIQCLLFADGGLTALGTNIFNMGLIGGIVAYCIFLAFKSILRRNRRGFLAASAIASWLSVVLASASCAVELALSSTSPLRVVLPAMVGVHSLIGIGEAVITTVVISMVLTSRPDLLASRLEAK